MFKADINLAARHMLEEQFKEAHDGDELVPVKNRYIIIDSQVQEVTEVKVFEFTIGDVDDPELYAADPLWKWQNSDQGRWVMKNALETPSWHPFQEPMTYGFRYIVTAKLTGPKLTEWLLKYGNQPVSLT